MICHKKHFRNLNLQNLVSETGFHGDTLVLNFGLRGFRMKK